MRSVKENIKPPLLCLHLLNKEALGSEALQAIHDLIFLPLRRRAILLY
jgi:hypothetical protein